MTANRLPTLCALLLCLTASSTVMAAAISPAGEADILLATDDVKRSDIEAAVVPLVSVAAHINAYATVLDAAALVTLSSELDVLAATAAASQAEAARSARLLAAEETVSRKSSEAATATARADAARLSASRRRIGLEWGQGLASLPSRDRASVLDALAEGRAALLRIGLSSAIPASPVATLDLDGSAVALRLLGRSASSDANHAGPSLLALAMTSDVQPGRVLGVQFSGAPLRGQRLPPAAVLSDAKGRFVYLETSAGHYRRQPVQVLDAQSDGLLVSGLAADARIVLRNAAALRWAAHAHDAE